MIPFILHSILASFVQIVEIHPSCSSWKWHMCTLHYVYKSLEDDSNMDCTWTHHTQVHDRDKHIIVVRHKRRWLSSQTFPSYRRKCWVSITLLINTKCRWDPERPMSSETVLFPWGTVVGVDCLSFKNQIRSSSL